MQSRTNACFIESCEEITVLIRDISWLAVAENTQVVVGTWNRTGHTLYIRVP
ncbi:MAG: hypothetical protein M0O96_07980 [Desulforhopalus sp.]|nr:hypothetical protein [Desulforhopalus sp.]